MNAPVPEANGNPRRTSDVIREFVASFDGTTATVSVTEIVAALRHRSYGGLILILAVVALVPGISIVGGLMIVVPAAQMMVGLPYPILPGRLGRTRLGVERLRGAVARILPIILYVERFVRPRWAWATRAPAENFIGALTIILAIVLFVPLPFTNFMPAVAMIVISLGFLERDGVIVVVGLATSVVALAMGLTAIFFGAEAVVSLLTG
ncbi:MAG: exopolysaccharide biosynthesis protein [Alphaproteobacteria bacterium]|nr:exopolysaccharide biosynthesis protein [Alphaproteobacteria bacterium]